MNGASRRMRILRTRELAASRNTARARQQTMPTPCIEKYKHVWERYRHVREEIGREWTLLSSRVGWLVTSQGFLFLVLKIGFQPTPQSGCLSTPPPTSVPPDLLHAHAVIWILPLIGISASFVVLLAVLAALARIRDLRRRQHSHVLFLNNSTAALHSGVCDDSEIENICASPPAVHFLGALPSLVIPVALFVAWCYIFGSEGWEHLWQWLSEYGFKSGKGPERLVLIVFVGVSVFAWAIAIRDREKGQLKSRIKRILATVVGLFGVFTCIYGCAFR